MDFSEKLNDGIKKFSLNVIYYRKLRKLNQDELAIKANLSRNLISKIEANNYEANPTLTTILSLAIALEIPAAKLFEFKDDE